MIFAFLQSGSSGMAAGVGIIAGAAFFLILAVVAFVAFRMLKRTAKMAMRLMIAGLILMVAAAGTVLIWWSSSTAVRPAKPANSRSK
jgi:hypothetical protein